MSHHNLNTFLHHPSLSNLVEIYEPIRSFGRALRGGEEKPFVSDGHTRRSSHHHEPAFSPDFDLRETPEAYFLEGEFPGISGRNALKLQWIDGCTLRVQGTIRKTDLKEEWGVNVTPHEPQDEPESPPYENDVNERHSGASETVAVQQPQGRTSESDHGKSTPAKHVAVKSWLNERRDGMYVRNFSFPAPVNTDAIQARLSRGLLRIMVPKTDRSLFKTKEIHIEASENE